MRVAVAVLAVVAVVSASGCGSTSKPASTKSVSAGTIPPAGKPIEVSSDYKPGAAIPRAHTCDGPDVSPPLHVTRLPRATKEIIVVMRDPDAPGGNFIHWVIAHIMPANGSLSLRAGATPPGAVLGRNSFGSLGYRGPCPPSGPAHHYVVTVYALGQPSGLKRGFSADDVTDLPVLTYGIHTGVYARR